MEQVMKRVMKRVMEWTLTASCIAPAFSTA
jgi:hypothetical protein